MILRALTADDWADFRAVRLESLRDAPEAFGSGLAEWAAAGEQRWRRRLTDVPCTVLAELDGRAAGVVSGTAPGTGGAVELLSLWVAPFARGRGAGDALVGAVLDWAKRHGARRVVLRVHDDNPHARNLYRRNGFVPAGGPWMEHPLTA